MIKSSITNESTVSVRLGFLFEKALILCKARGNGNLYKFKEIIPLCEYTIEEENEPRINAIRHLVTECNLTLSNACDTSQHQQKLLSPNRSSFWSNLIDHHHHNQSDTIKEPKKSNNKVTDESNMAPTLENNVQQIAQEPHPTHHFWSHLIQTNIGHHHQQQHKNETNNLKKSVSSPTTSTIKPHGINSSTVELAVTPKEGLVLDLINIQNPTNFYQIIFKVIRKDFVFCLKSSRTALDPTCILYLIFIILITE